MKDTIVSLIDKVFLEMILIITIKEINLLCKQQELKYLKDLI